ncbi:MAG: MmcQ/YjbR family DNA-binding protein [Thermoplasmata archaeon]|nr:MmcQ/YjbR family DNA-binding protein [Thermoplasmata archaeon]
MDAEGFRRIALKLPEAEERFHQGHPDFRVRGRIFATLGSPHEGWGMVKLELSDQAQFIEGEPRAFVPANGSWGQRGATSVRLQAVSGPTLERALRAAWANVAAKVAAPRVRTRR